MNKITSLFITENYVELATEDGTVFTADVDDIISYAMENHYPYPYGTFQLNLSVKNSHLGKLNNKITVNVP